MSFKPLIQTMGDDKFYPSAICFATPGEAEGYALDLISRWTLAVTYKVEASGEPVNYRWDTNLGLLPVERK